MAHLVASDIGAIDRSRSRLHSGCSRRRKAVGRRKPGAEASPGVCAIDRSHSRLHSGCSRRRNAVDRRKPGAEVLRGVHAIDPSSLRAAASQDKSLTLSPASRFRCRVARMQLSGESLSSNAPFPVQHLLKSAVAFQNGASSRCYFF